MTQYWEQGLVGSDGDDWSLDHGDATVDHEYDGNVGPDRGCSQRLAGIGGLH